MSTYRSCHSIEGEIFFNHLNKVGYCCMLTPNGGQPVLMENYTGELVDWDEFFKKRDAHIELMKNGNSLDTCKDCLWIKNAKWDERKKEFRYILLNIWVKCNLYCVYCTNHTDSNVLNNTKDYNIVPVLQDMIDKKIITENTKFDIAGGEATLDKNFDELISLLINAGVKNININTNATIFSNSVKDGISKGCISIISSVDSGSAKMFEQIKKKSLWLKVWENLNEYSSALLINNTNTVRTKYIIVPKLNDSRKEIKNFIKISKKNKVSGVILNVDLHWLRKNADDIKAMKKIIELAVYFKEVATAYKLDWQIWAHIEDLIKRYNILVPNEQIDLDLILKKQKLSILNYIYRKYL